MAITIWAYPERFLEGKWQRATELIKNPDYWPVKDNPAYGPCPNPEYIPRTLELGFSKTYAALLIYTRKAWSVNEILPIVPERGFPMDASPEVAADYQAMKEDVKHSSWLTLRELEDFPWKDRRFTQTAMVSESDAKLFKPDQHGLPDGVKSYSEMSHDGERVYWTSSYLEAFGEEHLNNVIAELRRYGGPDQVRLVIWCDL